ncbi:MAG: ATP-binding protein [Armatimonadota bacterium]|nr:MAG: ATP-binding protein [Armatimonadota bacterium]
MVVAVASGKGGTGKTTVAVSLALSVTRAQLVDADAEEPNAHLFLSPGIRETVPVAMAVPEVHLQSCTFCGRCAAFCRFNALAVVKEQVLVFPELCHGCGGCIHACPEGAIERAERRIGEVEVGEARGRRFIQGRLRPGAPSAVRIVREEMTHLDRDVPAIIDAPPGTACAVQEVMAAADFCLLVTEPTPFGLHDLRMAIDLAAQLEILAAVVINRSGRWDSPIEDECRRRGVPVLLKIPFERQIAEAYSRGEALTDAFPEYSDKLRRVYAEIESGVRA